MNYYFICFLVSIVLSVAYIYKWHNRYNVYFTMLFIFIPIANLGYWKLSLATELSQAVLANQIQYIGACFTPLVVMLSIYFICKIKLPKLLELFMFVFTMVVYGSVLTTGMNGIFYRSVSLEMNRGSYQLVKEYGPMHRVFYVMLLLYLLMSFGGLLYAVKKKKDVSLRSASLLFAIYIITLAAFALGRMIGGVELTAACYDIFLFVFLVVTDRLILYNVDETVFSAIMRKGEVGVAAFDLKHRFLGCNQIAKEYYPPLQKLHIDHAINPFDEDLSELVDWFTSLNSENGKNFHYENGENYYRITFEHLYDGKKRRGYNLIIHDYTQDRKQEKYLEDIAITDELTALFNRRAFDDDIAMMEKEGISDKLVIVSIDLNGLKHVNDSLGHGAGDELIIGAANCLRKVFANKGKIYRTGGDEFTALLLCGQKETGKLLQLLVKETASWKGVYVSDLSLSYGMASREEFITYSIQQLEQVADYRMYENKNSYYEATGYSRRKYG